MGFAINLCCLGSTGKLIKKGSLGVDFVDLYKLTRVLYTSNSAFVADPLYFFLMDRLCSIRRVCSMGMLSLMT